jgi:hypothetical protein
MKNKKSEMCIREICYVCSAEVLMNSSHTSIDRVEVKSKKSDVIFIYNRYYFICPVCGLKKYISRDMNDILSSYKSIKEIDMDGDSPNILNIVEKEVRK